MSNARVIQTLSFELANELSPAFRATSILSKRKRELGGENLQNLTQVLKRSQEICLALLSASAMELNKTHNPGVMEDIFSRIIMEVTPQATPKIHFETDVDCIKTMEASYDAIYTMTGSLVANAVQALKNGRGGKILLRAQTRANALLIDVMDDGPGAATCDLAEIYTSAPAAFIQCDRLNFVLSATAMLARNIGGDLMVLPGEKGCAFRLLVPATLKWET